MGRDMMLPGSAMALFCVYFYVLTLGDMRYMYMSARGLFWEQRWRAIAETVLNLVLNIVLGKLFGVYGIIVATMVSLLLCNYIWSNRITFRAFFGMSYLKKYYGYQGRYTAVTVLVCLAAYAVCSVVSIDSIILTLLFRAAVCVVLPIPIYYLVYRKTAEFKYLTGKLLHKA